MQGGPLKQRLRFGGLSAEGSQSAIDLLIAKRRFRSRHSRMSSEQIFIGVKNLSKCEEDAQAFKLLEGGQHFERSSQKQEENSSSYQVQKDSPRNLNMFAKCEQCFKFMVNSCLEINISNRTQQMQRGSSITSNLFANN